MASSDRRIKVLWITKGLGPGGAERLLLSFAQRADHDRFEFNAGYLLPWKDHLVGELDSAGVAVHALEAPRVWDVRWTRRLRRLVVDLEIDVVHTHSPAVAAPARAALRIVPRGSRPALVTTEHNVWDSHHPLTRVLNRVTMRLDDHVFAVSDEVAASMRTGKDVEVLMHGVDVEGIAARRGERGEARQRFGLPDETMVVVTVANLRSNKDYPKMLQAARRLVDDGLDVTFLAVGQGPLETELADERDRLGLGDHFRFLGYQSDPIGVLAAGDVFCLSSRYEGLPIALLEALALGLPVVATEVGGIPTLLRERDGAVLVPPGDSGAFADALASMLQFSGTPETESIDIRHAVQRQSSLYEVLALKP